MAAIGQASSDAAPRSRSGRALIGFWWFALSGLAVALFAPLPYLASSLQELTAADNQLAANYVDRAGWLRVAFYLHITGAGLALLLSPVQFVARLRDRAPTVHRVCGRIVLVGIAVGGLAGLALAPHSLAGLVGTAGFGLLALLWLVFAGSALRAIRRGAVATHRRWAVRTFALTYAAVTLRLWLGGLIALQIAVAGVDDGVAFERAYLLVPFLSWVPNLLVAEWYLRRRRLARPGPVR